MGMDFLKLMGLLGNSTTPSAPYIYPQETRDMISSGMPLLGGAANTAAGAGATAATAANPILGGAMAALGVGTSLLGNKTPPPSPVAPSASGRGYPWQNTALYQQASAVPNMNFMSMLSRMLKG